jgi:hypothetical protein
MIKPMRICRSVGVCLSIAFVFFAGSLCPQESKTVSPPALSSSQIVAQMQRHNLARTQNLKHYEALRHYLVEYKGLGRIAGTMDVKVTYDTATGKSFQIVSQSGSKLLCEKVLKRAVDSEKEAQQDRGATALNETNYKFHFAGMESLNGRPAYILDVEPVTASKFLYRGKVWVDAADFALAKVEATPAKNPSFWISRTLMVFTNAETGGFWLPERSRSETRVRIGGTAVLSIDYGRYDTVPLRMPMDAAK